MCSLSFLSYQNNVSDELKLTQKDRAEGSEGAMFAGFIQCLMVIFVCLQFSNEGTSICIPTDQIAFLCRFFSGLLMHFQLEPKLRIGLNIMKYSYNHPDNLRHYSMAFHQGSKLFIFTLFTEVLCIMYICTQSDVIEVIIKTTALASICKVVETYAQALPKNSRIKQVARPIPIERYKE